VRSSAMMFFEVLDVTPELRFFAPFPRESINLAACSAFLAALDHASQVRGQRIEVVTCAALCAFGLDLFYVAGMLSLRELFLTAPASILNTSPRSFVRSSNWRMRC
jgi:hypothetical protein